MFSATRRSFAAAAAGHRLMGRRSFATSLAMLQRGRFEPNQWDLLVGLQLQRPPVIVPELNWLAKKVDELNRKVEVANSVYSDHEMRHFEDIRRAKRIASGEKVEEKDLEEAAKQNARDFEEASLLELKQFQFADRATKADQTQNKHSVDRALDRYLYLLVKTKVAGVEHWLLPQEFHRLGEESLRATAERLYSRLFPQPPPLVTAKFLGNTPAGHFQYRYPRSVAEERGKVGGRLFFYKACLNVGNQSIDKVEFGERVLTPSLPDTADFGWLTYAEMQQAVPKQLWPVLRKTLYTDELVNIDKLVDRQKSKFHRYTNRLKKFEASVAN